MNIDGLKYFVTVAECRSFSKAAEMLYITQPALSRHIQRLEEELGAPLLKRSRRDGVTATEFGLSCLQDAKQIVALAERIAAKAADCTNGENGTIIIGYNGSEGEFLFSLIRYARKLYPDMNVVLHHENMSDLHCCVMDGRVDLAFLYQTPGETKTDELTFLPLQESRMELLVSKKHLLAKRKSVRMEMLKDEPFVELNRNIFPEFYDAFHRLCQQHGFSPRTVCEDESQAIFSSISVGDGIGYILSGTENSFASHPIHVVDIEQQDETQKWILSLAWHKRNGNPCIRPVLAVAEKYLRQKK